MADPKRIAEVQKFVTEVMGLKHCDAPAPRDMTGHQPTCQCPSPCHEPDECDGRNLCCWDNQTTQPKGG